jgi:CubicO group peptidase (beta-lactamase class C family)
MERRSLPRFRQCRCRSHNHSRSAICSKCSSLGSRDSTASAAAPHRRRSTKSCSRRTVGRLSTELPQRYDLATVTSRINRRAFVASLSAILALLVALVIISSVAPPLAAQPPLPDTVEGFERVFVGWAQKQGITGGTVAVARDNRLVLIKGYGDRRGDDRVLLASLSKAITAVCVATLVQQERLSFSTSLGKILPRSLGTPVDPGLRTVTIEQLLTHRAGFGDGHGGDLATGQLGGELFRMPWADRSTSASAPWRYER